MGGPLEKIGGEVDREKVQEVELRRARHQEAAKKVWEAKQEQQQYEEEKKWMWGEVKAQQERQEMGVKNTRILNSF